MNKQTSNAIKTLTKEEKQFIVDEVIDRLEWLEIPDDWYHWDNCSGSLRCENNEIREEVFIYWSYILNKLIRTLR